MQCINCGAYSLLADGQAAIKNSNTQKPAHPGQATSAELTLSPRLHEPPGFCLILTPRVAYLPEGAGLANLGSRSAVDPVEVADDEQDPPDSSLDESELSTLIA